MLVRLDAFVAKHATLPFFAALLQVLHAFSLVRQLSSFYPWRAWKITKLEFRRLRMEVLVVRMQSARWEQHPFWLLREGWQIVSCRPTLYRGSGAILCLIKGRRPSEPRPLRLHIPGIGERPVGCFVESGSQRTL